MKEMEGCNVSGPGILNALNGMSGGAGDPEAPEAGTREPVSGTL